MSHAFLAPSAASRWLTCTPSAMLESQQKKTSSVYADEGTLAHALGELIIKRELAMIKDKDFKKQLKVIEGSEYYNDSMYDYCDDYATFVIEKYHEMKATDPNTQIYLEVKLDLSKYIPESFGTSDVAIISDRWLIEIDLKYGKGVSVDAAENKQLMVYALGVIDEFSFIHDIEVVDMIIYQPRIDNISHFKITVEALKMWAESYLRPRAQLAFNGQGEFVPGDHCRFCAVKATCKAHAEFNLQLAKFDFEEPKELIAAEIAEILGMREHFINWINAVAQFALHEALQGTKWPGFKLVAGRSNRKYEDEQKVIARLSAKGYDEDEIIVKKLKGITAMQKELGKKDFDRILSDLIIKPAGKPALVSVEDKRAELNSLEQARKDFYEQDIHNDGSDESL